LHEEFCGEDGISKVHAQRKTGEPCVIDFAPDSVAEQGYLDNEMMGVYMHKGQKYVSKTDFKRRCNVVDDISAHPFLKFLRDVLAVSFTVLILCILITC